jgi:hypothetical protein
LVALGENGFRLTPSFRLYLMSANEPTVKAEQTQRLLLGEVALQIRMSLSTPYIMRLVKGQLGQDAESSEDALAIDRQKDGLWVGLNQTSRFALDRANRPFFSSELEVWRSRVSRLPAESILWRTDFHSLCDRAAVMGYWGLSFEMLRAYATDPSKLFSFEVEQWGNLHLQGYECLWVSNTHGLSRPGAN